MPIASSIKGGQWPHHEKTVMLFETKHAKPKVLHVPTTFDPNSEPLVVWMRSQQIPTSRQRVRSDPYVVCFLGSEVPAFHTAVRRQTLDPVWDEDGGNLERSQFLLGYGESISFFQNESDMFFMELFSLYMIL